MAHNDGNADGLVKKNLVTWKKIREFCGSALNDYSPDEIKSAFKKCIDEGLIENVENDDGEHIGYCPHDFVDFNAALGENSDVFRPKKIIKKSSNAYSPSEETEKICDFFIKYLTIHKPDRKPTTDSTKISWCKEIDSMLSIDNRTPRRICEVIKWIYTKSDFWPPNIQSAKKLREQFDKLELQIKRDNGGTIAKIPDGMVLEKGESVQDALVRYEKRGLVPPKKLAKWKQELSHV
jgi:hypothetical protein